jgi:alkyl hydroperoxide reductase subunit AhpC
MLYFVIMTGVVRHITVNDINVGRNVDEILRLIKAHQFVEVSACNRICCVCPLLHMQVSMRDNCVTPTLLV